MAYKVHMLPCLFLLIDINKEGVVCMCSENKDYFRR